MSEPNIEHRLALATALFDVVHVLQSYELSERIGKQGGAALSALSVRALWHLGRNGRQTQSELARELGVSAPTASKLVVRLEARGFLARTRGSDRRTRSVELTPDGRDAARSVFAAGDHLIDSAIGLLGGSDVDRLVAILQTVRASIRSELWPESD